jgi:hypothetical protein
MSRGVWNHPKTWIDSTTVETFLSWSEPEQQKLFKEIGKLSTALKDCTDPLKDPTLKRFRPTSYHGAIDVDDIYEYRLSGLTRVVARVKPKWVLMLTITLSHGHDLMRILLKVHRETIAAFSPPEE